MGKKEVKNTIEVETENAEVEVVEKTEEELRIEQLIKELDPADFLLGNGHYRLVKNYREGFDYRALLERYHEILNKYDYIVGDWGYDQLRLKGFFKDDFRNAAIDAKISHLEDYLYEYCNFGCAYFVIEQFGEFHRKGRDTSNSRPRKKPKPKPKNQVEETKKEHQKPRRKSNFKKKEQPRKDNKKEKKEVNKVQTKAKGFVIREREQ